MAQNNFLPTDAFDHRYANPDVLRDILQKPPFSFKPKEIVIRASQGSGFQVKLPRKLKTVRVHGPYGTKPRDTNISVRQEERDKVTEALDNVHGNDDDQG
ncbi:hypothetical protein OQA88_3092 [Cercophora sp. LCS_1]